MDVGIINPELIYPRGAEKQACNLCYFLNEMGHEVTFYTFVKKKNYIFDPLLSDVKVISLNKRWSLGSRWIMNDPRWIHLARKLSRKIGPHDIINAHNHPAQWISKFIDIPVIWMCNEPYMYTNYKSKNGFQSLHYMTDRFMSSNVKLILSLDSRMQELIKKMFPSKSIRIIGSGVDLKRDIRHVQNDCFDSIFVGPIHPQKRPLDIVKAFSLIKNEIKHVKLHFIGEIMSNELKKEMEKVAVDNNLKIIFHGTISDEKLYDLYDIADIAIFVPGLQPWGIFPLETILGGIPTIISDECGIIDVLPRDFPIVKTGHINELASKILEIEDNYQEHKNKVIKVKKIISDEYSWESYAKRMFDVYDNCLNTL